LMVDALTCCWCVVFFLGQPSTKRSVPYGTTLTEVVRQSLVAQKSTPHPRGWGSGGGALLRKVATNWIRHSWRETRREEKLSVCCVYCFHHVTETRYEKKEVLLNNRLFISGDKLRYRYHRETSDLLRIWKHAKTVSILQQRAFQLGSAFLGWETSSLQLPPKSLVGGGTTPLHSICH
jgi:hypothetical protein